MKPQFYCYAPGMSPLVFCWKDEDTDQNISAKPVTPSMIRKYIKGPRGKGLTGYNVHKIEGRWTAMNPVKRLSPVLLEMDGKRYRYRITNECPADRDLWWASHLRVEFQPDRDLYGKTKDEWWQIRNWSILGQLTWFLRYESIWEQTKADTGKRIKDSDTWGEKKLWMRTEFPDGDGRSFK